MAARGGDLFAVSPSAPILSPIGQAALSYARRGWPVFPCRERDETITTFDGKTRTLKAKQPYGGNGVKDATCDEDVVKGWWRRWPDAMIGLAMGHNGLFALDFDPRVDAETGEVFTLESLKGELEGGWTTPRGETFDGIGPLPRSLTAITQSGGVHVYLRQPSDGGEPIRNRGNLPLHVDVRGLGGYVIAPPSILYHADGSQGRYRWHGDRHEEAVEAPAALIEILRSKGKKAADPGAAPPPPRRPVQDGGSAEMEAIRKYGDSALAAECRAVRDAPSGARNSRLNEAAVKIASLTVSTPFPALEASWARSMLEAAARANPGEDDDRQLLATIDSGWTAGAGTPRDLTEVATRARERAARPHRSSRSAHRPPAPGSDEYGEPRSHGGGSGAITPEKGAGEPLDVDMALKCAMLPMTDLGNLERFLLRRGGDFLFVPSWAESNQGLGCVAWDGMRWNRSMADAMFAHAAQQVIRQIQEEADYIRTSGVPFPPEEGDLPAPEGEEANPDEAAADMPDGTAAEKAFARAEARRLARRSSQWYAQRALARRTGGEGPRHDYIAQIKSNGDVVLYSDKLAAWGRSSESSGHIDAIRRLAPARLTARPEDFDADPLALNLPNGTLYFHRPEGSRPARVELRPHRREDRITKIARAAYDPDATCPRFDAFLADVQPADDMREWLTRWAGYNALGIADAQVMALFYGEGQNGKGVWVQTHAHILGDYAWATGIETFMDSGFKRNGGGPSPHLAALAGRRMVYANEPEDNSKFSDGLVKSLTSDEPIGGVRALYGPAFELMITFTNTVMANNLPRIGTDFGIRRRMQVVPWSIIVPEEKRDKQLKDKLRAEQAGILNRMIAGALAYLTDGLTMPEVMAEASKAYHEDNDLLGQFLTMCVVRDPGATVGATALHDLFKAWQTWSGNLPQTGQPWSTKKLRMEMERKSFRINKSSTMKWQDIALRFDRFDFVDEGGKPVERDLPAPRHADKPSAGVPIGAAAPVVPPSPLPPAHLDDDDLPP